MLRPDSHRQWQVQSHHHDAICARAPGARAANDHVPVLEGGPIFCGATGRLVCAAAGDLILWGSRIGRLPGRTFLRYYLDLKQFLIMSRRYVGNAAAVWTI
jgi:hypothetical protein